MFLARPTFGTRLARHLRSWALAGSFLLGLSSWLPGIAQISAPTTSVLSPLQLHLPVISGGVSEPVSCPLTSDNSYTILPVTGPLRDPDLPPLLDPDLNLFIRGYKVTNSMLQLVAIDGPTDDDAPQLAYLFRPARVPTFRAVHQVYEWDWGCRTGGCKGQPIAFPEVTLVEMATVPEEPLYPPRRNANVGSDSIALVLYAEQTRLTLTYTHRDTPAVGYVVHIEDLCVDPNLLALYEEMHLSGRTHLPALGRNDIIGSALDEKVLVAVRDSGSFMDPRSAKDWWQEIVRTMLAAQ